MRKQILCLILSMVLLLGMSINVSAAQPVASGSFGGSLETNMFCENTYALNTDSPQTNYWFLGTADTASQASGVMCYPVYSDGSDYSASEDKRIIGFFFLSSTSLPNIGVTIADLDESTGEYKFSTAVTVSFGITYQLTDYKDSSIYDSYWKEYLAQFEINDENYDEFLEEYSGYYCGFYDISTGFNKAVNKRTAQNVSHSLRIYPLLSDGSKYDASSISTLESKSFSPQASGTPQYFLPFLYVSHYGDDKGEDSNGDSSGGTGGGGGHEFAPDVSFYLTPKNYRLQNIISQYWQCEWYLSWKNNDTSFDISDYTVEIYTTSALLLDIKGNISKYRPMISEREGDVTSKCILFYNTCDLSSGDVSVGSYLNGYLSEDWRPKKSYPFHVLVRMVKDDVATSWTDFLCNPDGSISATYQRTTDMDLSESDNLIGDDGNRTDGTAVDENGGSVSDQADTESAKKYGSDPYVETPQVDLLSTFQTLSNLIDYLGQLPSLIARTLTFLPSEVLALISSGLTLFLIVGIIKFFK